MIKYTEKDIVTYKNFFDPEDFETVLDSLKRPSISDKKTDEYRAKKGLPPVKRK